MWRRLTTLAIVLAGCGGSGDVPPDGRVDLAFPPVFDLAAGCPLPTSVASVWNTPNAPYAGQCAPDDIDAFVTLVTQQGAPGLRTFMAQSPQCGLCLGGPSPSTDSGTLPFVERPNGVLDLNVGVCVALSDGNVGFSGCGAAVHARDDCLAQACAACGPVRIAADQQHYDQCLATAAQSSCVIYAAPASCLDTDPAAAKCRSIAWPSTADWVRFYAELFCGTPGDL